MAIVSGIFREILRQAEANRFYYDEEEPEEEIAVAPPKPKAPVEETVNDPNRMVFEKNDKVPNAAESTGFLSSVMVGTGPDDLLRGIVMAEVLGPPVSRKRGFGPTRR
jgi:hypothetical protein